MKVVKGELRGRRRVVIHIISMHQTDQLYWFAKCSCTWVGAKYPKLAEAEREGQEHSDSHNEASA